MIVLSGGEPTLRKDWITISEKIKSENMNVGIISNALAWDNATIDKIIQLQPYAVGFSVDGEKELHDYLRGINGSHDKIFQIIKELKKNNITICAITSVNNMNLKELHKIRNRLLVYDVDAWQLQTTSPMGRMKKNTNLILDNDEYYNFAKFIVDTRNTLSHMNIQAGDCVGYYGKLESKIRDSEWNGCMAGIKGIGIESNGNIKGCLSIQSKNAIEGNIRNNSLNEIWSNDNNFKYNRQFVSSDLKDGCADCKYGSKCGGGCQSQSIAFFNEFHNSPYCLVRYENSCGGK